MRSPRQHSNARGAEAQRYHAWYRTPPWLRERAEHLQLEPWCRDCLRAGRRTKATTVDHIEPHRGNWALFWDRGNWQSQCDIHHADKQRIENGGAERVPVGKDGWPLKGGGVSRKSLARRV